MNINEQLAAALEKTSKYLKFKKENRFKIRAFEDAAERIRVLDEAITEVAARGEVEKLPSVGKGMAVRIKEFIEKGWFSQLRELEKEIPPSVLELMEVPGLGPERTRALYDSLGIKNARELKMALRNGKVSALDGFGEKVSANIIEGLSRKEKYTERMQISEADLLAEAITARLKSVSGIKKVQVAGSLRRRKETIGDIDILYTSSRSGLETGREFTAGMDKKEILALGEEKTSFLYSGRQIDLRKIDEERYGAALQYFTGSKEHAVPLRKHAKKFSMKLSEYGLFKDVKTVASKTEKDIYEALGMDFIPPELRENEGEIEAALNRSLPCLVELKDIKGDCHVHSEYSDGGNSIDEIAAAAQKAGYSWVCICDHSKSLRIAGGLDERKLEEKIKEIRQVNKKYSIEVLCGQEVDIRDDGSLDYSNETLSKLDVVIAAVHSGFSGSRQKITGRVLRAMENPYVHIIAHLSGRLLNEREAYAIDINAVIEKAAETGTALEINAYPRRLDLYYNYARLAARSGVKLAIGTDSHHLSELAYMKYGLDVARRGWLEKKDLLNTISTGALKEFLSEKRGG